MKGKGSGIDGQKTYNKTKRGDIGIQNLSQKTKDKTRERATRRKPIKRMDHGYVQQRKPINAIKPKSNPMMRNVKNSGISEALLHKSSLNL